MIIAIDIDKTIVNCRSMVYQVANKLEKVIPKMPKKPTFLNKSEIGKYRNLFGKIGDPKYYDEVENCVDVINKFSKEGNTVVLLSSRPNMRTFNNVILTWLEEHKLNYNFLVVNCADKAKFCEHHGVKILIDDGVKHCIKTNKKGIATILFDPKDKYGKNDAELEEQSELDNYLFGGNGKLENFDFNERNLIKNQKQNCLVASKGGKFEGKKDFYIAKSWDDVEKFVAKLTKEKTQDEKPKEESKEETIFER